VTDYPGQTDDQLAARSSKGDRDAFAALYQRQFQGVYDFATRIVQDPDSAADVVQSTFIKTWEQLNQGKIPRSIKAWIYTLARNAAIDELRRRKRVVSYAEGEAGDVQLETYAKIDPGKLPDPQAVIEDKELSALVWRAASALRPEEYALLDLSLRQGLTADELSESLGLRKGTLYTRLSRLKDSLEETVVAELLMRRGRRECPELDALLSKARSSRLDRDIFTAIKRHLQECPRCQESSRRYIAPAEIFAGLAFLPVAPTVSKSIWTGISTEIGKGLFRRGILRPLIKALSTHKAIAVGTGLTIVTLAGVMALIVGPEGARKEEQTETPTIRSYNTPTEIVAEEPSSGLSPTSPPVLSFTKTITATSTISSCPTPTDIASVTPTSTQSSSPSATHTPTITPSPSPSATHTPTITPSPTSSKTPTPTITPTPSHTPTFTPVPIIWENDPFDGLNLGALHNQHGWVASQASAQVTDYGGGGKILRVDPGAGTTILMGKDVPNQNSGIHRFELDVRVDGASEPSLAKIEMGTTSNAGWDKKFQIYFGNSIRVNYSISGGAVTIVSSTQKGRWYHISCEMDLDSRSLDVWVDGSLAASEITMHTGPITELRLAGWDRAGVVYLDNLLGVK
jgi:RNA polymerase sigma factor (sigma-70 family)